MGKHTPGPWYVVEEADDDGDVLYSVETVNLPVADIYRKAEHEANARLIAAAPDMHALLLQIHTELSHTASADADPENWEGYTLHRIEQLLWQENTGGNHETG